MPWFGDDWIPDGSKPKERQPPISRTEHEHYAYLHDLQICAITGRRNVPIEVEHLRIMEFRLNKTIGGMGMKPHYMWTLPISAKIHRENNGVLDVEAWRRVGWPCEDLRTGPLACAAVLFSLSCIDDVEGGRRWLSACRLARLP